MKPLSQVVFRASVVVFAASFLFFSCTLSLVLFMLTRGDTGPAPLHALNGDVAWPAFNGGGSDTGWNTSEHVINTSNVGGLKKLWSASTVHPADNAVVEQPNVVTSQGVMDLVFVNSTYGNLIAYNAWTGAKIWEADPPSTNYNGQGTKSTPAIDPSGNYIYSYALDGYVHKYNIGSGTEVTGNGFPAQVTLLPNDVEKGSASINIGGGYLYMTLSGNDGDYNHYVGHVVAVNLTTGVKTVWNAECSNITVLESATSGASNYCSSNQSGIWARPGVKIDPVTGNIFFSTGNGNYNASSGGNNWGDSIIEMKPDLSQVVDSYTPTEFGTLDSLDEDLGSSDPVLLPTISSSNTPYMLVQVGKDGYIRLINRSNMSGLGGPRHIAGEMQKLSYPIEVHEQPATWTDPSGNVWVFVTDENGALTSYKIVTTSGVSRLVQQYQIGYGPSASPFVANGVLYIEDTSVKAINPTTGAQLFDSSSIGVSLVPHWESPVVVNGLYFTPDKNGNVVALYVPGATVIPPSNPGNVHTTAAGTNSISIAWNAATDTAGPGLAGYKVYRNGTMVSTLTGASTLSYTDSGLNQGTNYSYTVSAYDTAGTEGGQSATLSASTTTGSGGVIGDVNNDGKVNITDLSVLLSAWGSTNSPADLNNDNMVNITDLSILLSHWTG